MHHARIILQVVWNDQNSCTKSQTTFQTKFVAIQYVHNESHDTSSTLISALWKCETTVTATNKYEAILIADRMAAKSMNFLPYSKLTYNNVITTQTKN